MKRRGESGHRGERPGKEVKRLCVHRPVKGLGGARLQLLPGRVKRSGQSPHACYKCTHMPTASCVHTLVASTWRPTVMVHPTRQQLQLVGLAPPSIFTWPAHAQPLHLFAWPLASVPSMPGTSPVPVCLLGWRGPGQSDADPMSPLCMRSCWDGVGQADATLARCLLYSCQDVVGQAEATLA